MSDGKFEKQSNIKAEMDVRPLCLRVRLGLREDLNAVPDWQNKLRNVIDEWLKLQ